MKKIFIGIASKIGVSVKALVFGVSVAILSISTLVATCTIAVSASKTTNATVDVATTEAVTTTIDTTTVVETTTSTTTVTTTTATSKTTTTPIKTTTTIATTTYCFTEPRKTVTNVFDYGTPYEEPIDTKIYPGDPTYFELTKTACIDPATNTCEVYGVTFNYTGNWKFVSGESTNTRVECVITQIQISMAPNTYGNGYDLWIDINAYKERATVNNGVIFGSSLRYALLKPSIFDSYFSQYVYLPANKTIGEQFCLQTDTCTVPEGSTFILYLD